MRRAVIGAVLVLIVALAGCGDDDEIVARDDNADEFCDQVEALAEADEEGEFDDLSEEEAQEAALDILEPMEDAAPDEIQEDVTVLREFIEDFADEDLDDLSDEEQEEFEARLEDFEDSTRELEDFAEDECDVELDLSGDDDEETTTTEEDDGGGGEGEFDELVDACGGGDLAACDELFRVTPVDSPEEDFAQTCGGLVSDELVSGFCEDVFDGSDPTEPPTAADPALQGATNACGEGDFAACDQVFRESGVDSPEEEYAQACGGRLNAPLVSGGCEVIFENA